MAFTQQQLTHLRSQLGLPADAGAQAILNALGTATADISSGVRDSFVSSNLDPEEAQYRCLFPEGA